VGLWQHPDEVGQAKNSARLLWLSLQACERHAPADLTAPLPADWLQPGVALLYPTPPGEAAAGTAPSEPLQAEAVHTLVVLDGTWRQSRAMLRAQPALAALPRLALPQGLLAAHGQRYRVRKAHQAGQLSTLESVALALGHLQGDAAAFAPLLQAFEGWVDSLMARAGRA
jgi:DTW domain-containing protein YfiP